METYCVTCKKKTANKNYSVRSTKQNILMLLSICTICGTKKERFIKNQEAIKYIIEQIRDQNSIK